VAKDTGGWIKTNRYNGKEQCQTTLPTSNQAFTPVIKASYTHIKIGMGDDNGGGLAIQCSRVP